MARAIAGMAAMLVAAMGSEMASIGLKPNLPKSSVFLRYGTVSARMNSYVVSETIARKL